jgi:hypothetical protein
MDDEEPPTWGGKLTDARLPDQRQPTERNRLGPKDTARMLPGEVTRIKAKFDRLGHHV